MLSNECTKMAVLSLLKAILLSLFVIAVIYFSYQGFHQVLDQQISTRAEYRFGDDDKGNIELFDITVCLGNQNKPAGLVQAGFNLSQILQNAEQTFNFTDERQIVQFDISPETDLGYNSINGPPTNPTWIPDWQHVLDWQSGHCYTFSPKRLGIEKAPIKSYSVYDNSQVHTLLFYGAKFKYQTYVTLHVPGSIYSFARNSGGNMFRLKQTLLDFVIKKSIIKSLSTSKRPCVSRLYYGKKSCVEELATRRFFGKTGCILPWMKQILQMEAEICSVEDEIYKEALQEYVCAMADVTHKFYNATEYQKKCLSFESLVPKCQNSRSCYEVMIEKSVKNEQKYLSVATSLALKWENSKILYLEEFVSYDIHNFIGEVGGFFGLFLGFSFTSLFVVLEWIQRKLGGKRY